MLVHRVSLAVQCDTERPERRVDHDLGHARQPTERGQVERDKDRGATRVAERIDHLHRPLSWRQIRRPRDLRQRSTSVDRVQPRGGAGPGDHYGLPSPRRARRQRPRMRHERRDHLAAGRFPCERVDQPCHRCERMRVRRVPAAQRAVHRHATLTRHDRTDMHLDDRAAIQRHRLYDLIDRDRLGHDGRTSPDSTTTRDRRTVLVAPSEPIHATTTVCSTPATMAA